jgi:hypothetical protein
MSKIEAFWENATADDVARVMAGETVEARFRGSEKDEWEVKAIAGWGNFNGRDGLSWAARGGLCYNYCCYRYCQVYREPSWYANKPDPGPGFRLLNKFPDEELKLGDEYFDRLTTTWRRSTNAKAGMPQPEKVWYRRRIEPVEPVESKPVLIRRRVVEIGDEMELPNGRVLMFNGEGFEVKQ